MSEQALSPDSSIKELFDAVQPEEGMRVLPTQIPAEEGKANLAILITGSAEEANVCMANLMSYVTEMHEITQQAEADGKIVDVDGAPIDDDAPSIIVPQ